MEAAVAIRNLAQIVEEVTHSVGEGRTSVIRRCARPCAPLPSREADARQLAVHRWGSKMWGGVLLSYSMSWNPAAAYHVAFLRRGCRSVCRWSANASTIPAYCSLGGIGTTAAMGGQAPRL